MIKYLTRQMRQFLNRKKCKFWYFSVKIEAHSLQIYVSNIFLDSNVTYVSNFGRKMVQAICSNVSLVYASDFDVKFIAGGQLLVDNSKLVQIFDVGFCLENFVRKSGNNDDSPELAMILCSPITPAINLTSKQVRDSADLSPYIYLPMSAPC